MADEYRGLIGAFVSAFRRSESYLLRSYVAASLLVGALAGLFLSLALVSWLGAPAPIGQRSLLGVIGILVFVPLFAPVLVVARRHRRGTGNRRADAFLALTGYGFVLAVYLALFISAPDPGGVTGPLGSVVAAVDALPRSYWIWPPLLSTASIWLAARLTRPDGTGSGDPGERSRG